MTGNVAPLLTPLVFVPVLTYAFDRQKYDWESMKQIKSGDDTEIVRRANADLELVPGHCNTSADAEAQEQAKLSKSALIGRSLTGFMTVALPVHWPMPMYSSGYIFSKKFFTGELTALRLLRSFVLTANRLGGCWHPMAIPFDLLRRPLRSVARTEDHCPRC